MSSSPAGNSSSTEARPSAAVDATAAAADPVHPQAAPAVDHSPHRPASTAEEVYYDGRPFMGGRVGTGFLLILMAVLLLAGPLLYWVLAKRRPSLVLTVTMVAAGLVLLAIPPIVTRARRYRITNVRIDVERGLFGKTVDTVEMWHVEDLAFRQSLFERLMGVGTILIKARDATTGSQPLRGVRNPRKLFATLEQRVIAVKRLAGVVKIDNG